MRERLTVSFVVLTVVLLLGALLVRAWTLQGLLRDHEAEELRTDAVVVRVAIEQRVELRRKVDRQFLAELVGSDHKVEYTREGQTTVAAEGREFAQGDTKDAPWVTLPAAGGTMTLSQSSESMSGLVADDRRSIALLVVLIGLLAGVVGFLIARLLADPFRQLAVAADALGRGRFDLDLPRSRIPEAQAISQALRGSAGRLQERLTQEAEFAEHASHVLRTPLTGLRLELEELTMRDDLPDDARQAAARSLNRVESMDVVAGELVQISRRGALVAGAEIPLRDLATQVAQRWADALAEHDRPLTAAVEGSLETTYTPGPVEHVLDLLLVDVLRRGQGAVRLVFDGSPDGHLKIRVVCAGDLKPTRSGSREVPLVQARAVVSALGGRLEGDNPMDGLVVLLPQR
ncbi:HAMP domain-containing sensor histidine kinase [Nocardioides sp. SYSU D00038]|uniref:sensor histidine kinase n=1 Tax=Nocardioides sp. SYSU D00038 TaxID=2812554 RepID=UPI0019672D9B|nr:HAMP domain-containing histidine kinase [Nocardioides sp. SYSU D00038]